MNMMKVMIFVLLSISLLLQGCMLLAVGAGAAIGAGTIAYIEGEFQTTYAASLDRTWKAALEALKDLNFRIIGSQKNETKGDIEAKQIGGDEVRIGLLMAGPATVLVKIRVGIFGDEATSRIISNKIALKLMDK